jgi:hypothetical protein
MWTSWARRDSGPRVRNIRPRPVAPQGDVPKRESFARAEDGPEVRGRDRGPSRAAEVCGRCRSPKRALKITWQGASQARERLAKNIESSESWWQSQCRAKARGGLLAGGRRTGERNHGRSREREEASLGHRAGIARAKAKRVRGLETTRASEVWPTSFSRSEENANRLSRRPTEASRGS